MTVLDGGHTNQESSEKAVQEWVLRDRVYIQDRPYVVAVQGHCSKSISKGGWSDLEEIFL